MCFRKVIEFAANAAIVIAGLSLAAVLVKNHLLVNQINSTVKNVAVKQESRPVQLSALGIDWTASRQTVVLALSTTCRFCTESAPFYKRLAQSRGKARLVAVFPQEQQQAQQYLANLGVSVDETKQSVIKGISGTPTILLVDQKGDLVDLWVGRLVTGEENRILKLLASHAEN